MRDAYGTSEVTEVRVLKGGIIQRDKRVRIVTKFLIMVIVDNFEVIFRVTSLQKLEFNSLLGTYIQKL
jgi:hypothetical protein